MFWIILCCWQGCRGCIDSRRLACLDYSGARYSPNIAGYPPFRRAAFRRPFLLRRRVGSSCSSWHSWVSVWGLLARQERFQSVTGLGVERCDRSSSCFSFLRDLQAVDFKVQLPRSDVGHQKSPNFANRCWRSLQCCLLGSTSLLELGHRALLMVE